MARQEIRKKPEPAATALSNIPMLLKELFARLRQVFGSVPDDYLVIDVETSGLSSTDFILQIGHCVVKDRRVVNRDSFFLNWASRPDLILRHYGETNSEATNEDAVRWLSDRVTATGEQIRNHGRQFHTPWERVVNEGVDPEHTLRDYIKWFHEVNNDHRFLLMHNGYHFDCKMFDGQVRSCLDDHQTLLPVFRDDNIFDTGALLKAAQLPMFPEANDTLESFCRRVCNVRRKGVRWSLNEYAVPLFGLSAKHKLSSELAHDAGFDAYVCHLLFEELRERASL